MRAFERNAELRAALDGTRGSATVGLVPTMGFLHEGHLSLLRAARRDCDLVVLTLFVNPAQFEADEDLDAYPRDLDGDLAKASEVGVDLAYAPAAEDLYPDGFATEVAVAGLTGMLCGAPSSRGAGHFRGVSTVVAKLLNIVSPEIAYFGQKDAQQALVIERMARDLDFPVRISVQPTVREADGLAMSSRNAYLDPEQRERAPAIRRALLAATGAARTGAPTGDALAASREVLATAGISPEYLEARDAADLSEIETFNGDPVLIAAAASLGGARLIDNVIAEADASGGAYLERNPTR